MDAADQAIVELLKTDGRLAHREIARLAGLSRSTVATRMQRLLSSGEVTVRGVVHPEVIGRGSLAYVGLDVTGRAEPVAARVAERDDVPLVSLTTGPYAAMAEIRVGSPRQIDAAVTELRSLDGVRTVDTLPYTEVLRDVVGPTGEVGHNVDAIDIALLRALQKDGRASYVDLAKSVNLSPAGVRRRVLRLLNTQVLRVGALVRQSHTDHQLAMGLGVRLNGDDRETTEILREAPAVNFLARTLGRYDLLLTLRAYAPGQLVAALENIRFLPGIYDIESWSHLRFVKESYASPTLGP